MVASWCWGSPTGIAPAIGAGQCGARRNWYDHIEFAIGVRMVLTAKTSVCIPLRVFSATPDSD